MRPQPQRAQLQVLERRVRQELERLCGDPAAASDRRQPVRDVADAVRVVQGDVAEPFAGDAVRDQVGDALRVIGQCGDRGGDVLGGQ
jgi:hypothetical protein